MLKQQHHARVFKAVRMKRAFAVVVNLIIIVVVAVMGSGRSRLLTQTVAAHDAVSSTTAYNKLNRIVKPLAGDCPVCSLFKDACGTGNSHAISLVGRHIKAIQPEWFEGQLCSTFSDLIFSENQITQWPPPGTFKHMSSLVRLRAENNGLTSIPANALQGAENLLHLGFAGNHIEHIHPDAFNGLTQLRRLELNMNELHAVPVLLLRDTVELTYFTVQANYLTSLPKNFFKKTVSLETVILDSNPWHCATEDQCRVGLSDGDWASAGGCSFIICSEDDHGNSVAHKGVTFLFLGAGIVSIALVALAVMRFRRFGNSREAVCCCCPEDMQRRFSRLVEGARISSAVGRPLGTVRRRSDGYAQGDDMDDMLRAFSLPAGGVGKYLLPGHATEL